MTRSISRVARFIEFRSAACTVIARSRSVPITRYRAVSRGMRICSSGLKNDPCDPFSDSTPVTSKEIIIRRNSFEGIGGVSETGAQGSFFNPDEQILIPLETARYRAMGTDRPRAITVQAAEL